MSTKLFSRVRLRSDVPAHALRAVLAPAGESARVGAAHHLLWTLFADRPDRERDFLWREHEPGTFYLLSDRAPVDAHGLFDVAPAKEFTPRLSVGDRLAFELRTNATVARGGAPGVRGKPCDIVMDAIHRLPANERAEARKAVVDEVAAGWMARQGSRAGFTVERMSVMGYSSLAINRGERRRSASLGVLDLRGILVVREAEALVAAIARGFGRGKAFGCGLMLTRRV